MCWRLIILVSHTWFQASATKQMRTTPCWAITQRVVVISFRSLGKSYWAHLKGEPWKCDQPLNMGQICCPETSVRDYHYSLRNSPEQRSSHGLYTLTMYLINSRRQIFIVMINGVFISCVPMYCPDEGSILQPKLGARKAFTSSLLCVNDNWINVHLWTDTPIGIFYIKFNLLSSYLMMNKKEWKPHILRI
jgi:hypothetical protein